MDLNTSMGTGPDGILAIFLNNCTNQLTIPLHHIFNCSLDQGHFPDSWKISYLKHILKSGEPHYIANYRPISVINACANLMEKLMADNMHSLLFHSIISQQQGFIHGRSTVTNLALYTHFINEAFSNGSQCDL